MDESVAKNIFSKKEMCYFVMVDKFFKRCPSDIIIKMINIINGDDKISLRILDWFVTRYAKKNIDFTVDNDVFDVHINYKAQLKSYKKKYFDPFRRKCKFNYTFDINGEKKVLLTTIGQLNFFGWAINNNIITFVNQSLSQITKAMNLSNKEDKKKKELKQQKKKSLASQDDSDDSDDNNDYSDSDPDSNSSDNDENDIDKESYSETNISENSTDKLHNNDNLDKNKDINKKSKKILIKGKNIKKSININATKRINDDEVELTLSFD